VDTITLRDLQGFFAAMGDVDVRRGVLQMWHCAASRNKLAAGLRG
jgi:hypothetical protein